MESKAYQVFNECTKEGVQLKSCIDSVKISLLLNVFFIFKTLILAVVRLWYRSSCNNELVIMSLVTSPNTLSKIPQHHFG